MSAVFWIGVLLGGVASLSSLRLMRKWRATKMVKPAVAEHVPSRLLALPSGILINLELVEQMRWSDPPQGKACFLVTMQSSAIVALHSEDADVMADYAHRVSVALDAMGVGGE